MLEPKSQCRYNQPKPKVPGRFGNSEKSKNEWMENEQIKTIIYGLGGTTAFSRLCRNAEIQSRRANLLARYG